METSVSATGLGYGNTGDGYSALSGGGARRAPELIGGARVMSPMWSASSPQTYVDVNFPIPNFSPGIGAICKHQLRVASATERITELPR